MLTLWWLKVKRAQKHMVDIHREAWRYASRHPYSFSRIRLPDSKRNVLYRMRITEQSNPMIAIMLGDFIHNLRCALDYIIVASVPRRRQNSASFPILLEDIFATDDDGNYVVNDAERRKNFETAINDLSPEARKCVIGTQPYHLGAKRIATTSESSAVSKMQISIDNLSLSAAVSRVLPRCFPSGASLPRLPSQNSVLRMNLLRTAQ